MIRTMPRSFKPPWKILFTSAYTANAVGDRGILNKDMALLQKPFTPSLLAHKLREVPGHPGTPAPDAARRTSLAKSVDTGNTP